MSRIPNFDGIFLPIINQGVMQGLFFVAQSLLDMIGAPIFVRCAPRSIAKLSPLPLMHFFVSFSWIFEKTGPTHIWEFIGCQLILCLLLWLIFYGRMILHHAKCHSIASSSIAAAAPNQLAATAPGPQAFQLLRNNGKGTGAMMKLDNGNIKLE